MGLLQSPVGQSAVSGSGGKSVKMYVVSTSGNTRFALLKENLLTVSCSGNDKVARMEARDAARRHTRETDQPTWVHVVDIKPVDMFRVEKQVNHSPLD